MEASVIISNIFCQIISRILDQSKFIQLARTLLNKARHEISEIEICPECYLRSAQPSTTDCFTKPCTIPHTLCWAKMKSYQSWPAKVLRVVNDQVDVQFFGQHDRYKKRIDLIELCLICILEHG